MYITHVAAWSKGNLNMFIRARMYRLCLQWIGHWWTSPWADHQRAWRPCHKESNRPWRASKDSRYLQNPRASPLTHRKVKQKRSSKLKETIESIIGSIITNFWITILKKIQVVFRNSFDLVWMTSLISIYVTDTKPTENSMACMRPRQARGQKLLLCDLVNFGSHRAWAH